jgi:tetratricopeptide (TPR) repeat protein
MNRRNTLLLTVMACSLWARGTGAQGLSPAELPLVQSYDLEAVGKLKDSLAALDQIPPQRKETYLGWARRGWLQYRIGQHTDSVESYRKAIALAPQSIEPRLGIMLPQLALHRWADAEATAKEVLKVDPASYLGTLRLAFVYYNQHRYAESAVLYRKLRDLYPSDTDVRSGLAWGLLKSGKKPEAAHEFEELLAINPRLAMAREGLQLATH